MPLTEVAFYCEADTVPVLDWLEELHQQNRKATAECIAKIRLLAQFGHELRRPHADMLREGIYELRAKQGRVQYRILYFFHGRNVALLAHALAKEDKVPAIDIKRAIERKKKYEQDPQSHTARQTIPQNPNDQQRP